MPRKKKQKESPVERRAALSDAADDAVRQARHRIDEKITQMLRPMLREGETMPSVAFILELLRRWLVVYRGHMIRADQEHQACLARLSRVVELRNRVAYALSQRLVDFRAFLKGVFGPEAQEIFGFAATACTPRPQETEALLAKAETVSDALRDPEIEVPPTQIRGVDADPKRVLPRLESEAKALRGHLQELKKKQEKVVVTRYARNEAVAEYDVVFSCVLDYLGTVSELAGEDDPARRIRRSARRRKPRRTNHEPQTERRS